MYARAIDALIGIYTRVESLTFYHRSGLPRALILT